MSETTNIVDYKTLKDCICRSCVPKGHGICDFSVDYEKLKEQVASMGLIPVNVNTEATRVTVSIIPYLNEYFEKSRLSWFDDNKFYTVLTFAVVDELDEAGQELIRKIEMDQVEDPDNDKVADMSKLVADYHCYFATVASYRNEDPKRGGKPSYVVICRANKVVIKDSNYQYNYRDMS